MCSKLFTWVAACEGPSVGSLFTSYQLAHSCPGAAKPCCLAVAPRRWPPSLPACSLLHPNLCKTFTRSHLQPRYRFERYPMSVHCPMTLCHHTPPTTPPTVSFTLPCAQTVDEVLARRVVPPGHPAAGRLAFLSGPSFAAEVAAGQPAAVTVAAAVGWRDRVVGSVDEGLKQYRMHLSLAGGGSYKAAGAGEAGAAGHG